MNAEGNILKMTNQMNQPVQYFLPVGENQVPLNPAIGKKLKLEFEGVINCLDTGKKIKKSYGQGYSYPSFIKLAACDICIVKPELCHYDKGTCREPEWGLSHCFQPHIIYLANSSGLKIGITRKSQVPTRWVDQGATQALAILEVKDRKTSGLIEMAIKKWLNDKTNWRAMLKGRAEEIDLIEQKNFILEKIQDEIKELDAKVLDEEVLNIYYPVEKYPAKFSSLSFDKKPVIEDVLMGIKGQYLIFEKAGVLNIRKHQGYKIKMSY